MSNPWDDPEAQAWIDDVTENLIPKLEASSVTISLVPSGKTDIKFAVELGLSIMMDKPIVLVVMEGTKVPAKLVKIADAIVEDPDDPNFHERFGAVITDLMKDKE